MISFVTATNNDTLEPSSIKELQIGDRVLIRGTKYGTLKYIGKIHVEDGIWCGIKLDGPDGKHNGKIGAVRYFTCPHRFGIFAPLRHVEKVIMNPKDARTFARQSIMSLGSDHELHDSSSQDSNLSEFSVSSNSMNRFPPRSPSKTRKRNLSDDLSNIETSNLLEKIKEKDLFIEKLQQQAEKDYSITSHATEKVTKLESRITELQEKYERKKTENKHLTQEKLDLIQRLENLQTQHDENQNHELTIPDDHRLLSRTEIASYEETKDKFVQLESINKKLLDEKHIYQEELKRHNELLEKENQTNKFIDELKKQIELLKSQVTDLQNKGNDHDINSILFQCIVFRTK
jgi:dynactin complex subunit